MAATVEELKNMIIDLRFALATKDISRSDCPYAYAGEKPIENCDSVGCDKCKRIFMYNKRKDIEKEVMAL